MNQGIAEPAGEIVRTGLTVSLAIQYDMTFPDDKLLKSSYTLYYPDQIRAEGTVAANILADGTVIGSASYDSGKMLIRFDQNAAGDSLINGGVLKVNEQDAGGRVYRSVHCEIKVPMIYTPSDNTGHEELAYSYADQTTSKTVWPEVKLAVNYKPMDVPMSVKQECVKQSGADAGLYKCITTITPGNRDGERKAEITIAQKLQDFMLEASKEVSYTVKDRNGAVISSKTEAPVAAGGYDYEEEAASGNSVKGHMAYKVTGFAKNDADAYKEDDQLIFTYYVRENPAIYNKSGEQILSVSAGVFDAAAFTRWDMSAGRIQPTGELAKKEVRVTPKPVYYSYSVKEENGKKYLEWKVTVNSNGIGMYTPKLTFETADKDKKYLNILQGSVSQTVSSFTWTYETAYGNDVKFTGNMPGTGGGGSLLADKAVITFRTDITDAFYEEKGGSYTFDAAVSLTWHDSLTPGAGTSVDGRWDDTLSRPVFDESLIQKSGTADAKNGTVEWLLKINAPRLALTGTVIEDQLSASDSRSKLEVTGVELVLPSGSRTPLDVKNGAEFDAAVGAGGGGGIYTVDGGNRLRIYAGDLTETVPADRERRFAVCTKVSDAVRYGNASAAYRNTAALSADSAGAPVIKTDTAQPVTYKSELLDKKGVYNKAELAIDWTVTVNKSQMQLTDMRFKDTIPSGLEYDDTVGISINKNGAPVTMPAGSVSTSANLIELDFSGENTQTGAYAITYRTKITDVTMLDKNTSGEGAAVTNRAELTSDETAAAGAPVIKDASVAVPVSVIHKSQTAGRANQLYTQWEVTVNDDYQDLRGDAGGTASAVISDSYGVYDEAGNPLSGITMDFRPSDMMLTAYFKAGGSEEFQVLPAAMAAGAAGTEAVVGFDTAARKFSVALPIQKGAAYAGAKYRLVYKLRTGEIASGIAKFKTGNSAVFTCDRGRDVPPQSTGNIFSDTIIVGSISGGGTVDPEYRKVTVIKTDSADSSKLLAGAKFELAGMYGVEQTGTTDAAGTVVFENVSKRLDYTIREVEAPAGYILSSGTKAVPKGSADVTLNVTDERAKGNIGFVKTGQRMTGGASAYLPLQGAAFRLYEQNADGSQGGATAFEAVSAADGRVSFRNVPCGRYVLRETAAPAGYTLSGTAVKVSLEQPFNGSAALNTVFEDGGDFDASSGRWKNGLERADVIIRLDKGGVLEEITGSSASGVHFILKAPGGSVAAEKTVAAADTQLKFEDVPYGNYELYVEGVIQRVLLAYQDAETGKLGGISHTSLNPDGSQKDTQERLAGEEALNRVTAVVVDKENTAKVLAGCRVALYRRSRATGLRVPLILGRTDAAGRILFYLPDSAADTEYVLCQTASVGAYETDPGEQIFTLTASGPIGEERQVTFYNPLAASGSSQTPPGEGQSRRPASGSGRKKHSGSTVPRAAENTALPTLPGPARQEETGVRDPKTAQETAGRLPKTGGFLDFTTLMLLGAALVCMGGVLNYQSGRKDKCGGKQGKS